MLENNQETTTRTFADQLQTVLIKRFPGCRRLVSNERLTAGASKETYCIVIETDRGERRLAMRRASGGVIAAAEKGKPALRIEAKLMTRAREAGVPEPEVFFTLEEEDGLGEAFVMEWLAGETLGTRIVRSETLAEVRPRLAYQCGQILARIHSIDPEKTGLGHVLPAMSPEALVALMWARYKAFNTPQPMIDYAGRWLKEHLPRNVQSTLTHNDFRNGNLMVSPEGVIAVLDWEQAQIGDPMRDLGWVCTGSWRFGRSDLPVGGFGTYEDLFRGYEDASGRQVDPEHVKFWEIYGSFWWAVGCLGMTAHYRSGYDKSVERLTIGRRSSECQVDCVNLLIPGPVALIEEQSDFLSSEMPRLDELAISVRDFLRGEVMGQTKGRTNFMARVASNALDIVLRDFMVGDRHRQLEHERLERLLGADGDLESLRWRLVHALRNGSIPLDHPGLAEHLRNTVVNQTAIDQPGYAGFKTARQRK